MRWAAAFVVLFLLSLAGAAAAAPASHQAADDSNTVQDCVKTAAGADVDYVKAERCIGVVANPCLDGDKAASTAAMNACIDRERSVWDDILNETYRRLGEKLDAEQKAKLRDMQRAWIASRDASCHFYWDYYKGTIASPMASSCVNRETARRALFLLGFLYADK